MAGEEGARIVGCALRCGKDLVGLDGLEGLVGLEGLAGLVGDRGL
jgi:hypothetical protein